MPKPKSEANFDANLDELEAIVNELEAGAVPLETAFNKFQAGIKLVKTCQTKLKKVEQQVNLIMEKNAELIEEPFLEEDEEDEDEF